MTDTGTPSQTAVSAEAFIEWAREHAVELSIPRDDASFDDLHFIRDVIGNKKVIAVGESAHYLHEWNRWRSRLFRYLVLEHGFSVFVLESALVEGRRVHDYVNGADDDWDNIAEAINNVWGVWGEINELIRWMRDWNKNPDRPRDLKFYGMDGTGGWGHGRFAYQAVYDYASRVDQQLADDLSRELGEEIADLTFLERTKLSDARFRELIASSSLVISRLEQKRISYQAATSRDDFDWALRCAQILRDVIQAIAQCDADFSIGFRQYWNVRDVSMAESLNWIRQREGEDAGIVIGAHNTHLQLWPVRSDRATSMGSYYASRFGREDTLFIGTASDRSLKGEPPIAESNQAAYAEVGPDCFFLDLRDAPKVGPVADWLSVERPDRSNLRYQPVCAGEAWDCFIFSRTLSTGTVERPGFLHSDPKGFLDDGLADFSGRYIISGFLAAVNTLDVFYQDGALWTDGQDDTSGEVFPPYRAKLHYCEDGKFRWDVWPSIIWFRKDGDAIRVSVTTPGGSLYHGERIGEPVG